MTGRVALLEHLSAEPHFDLFFEAGPALKAFRLKEAWGGWKAFAAESAADHRLDYLDFEGEVSGGRGTVRRVDAGTYFLMDPLRWAEWRPGELLLMRVQAGLFVGELRFRPAGGGYEVAAFPDSP